MDWSTLALEHPTRLWLLPLSALTLLGLAALGGRHAWRTRLAALVLRMSAVAVICLLLATPTVAETQVTKFEPQGQWRLLLASVPPAAGWQDFREDPQAFVARVRNALAGPTPPARCEVIGVGDHARWARDALAALGMPSTLVSPAAAPGATQPILLGIDAPRVLQPGEPLSFTLNTWGEGEVRVTLDGLPLPVDKEGTRLTYAGKAVEAGRHLLEAALIGPSGAVLQRVGHILRVGEKPRLLLLGMDDARAAEAARLAPDFEHARCATQDFSAGHLAKTQVVLAGIDALYRLRSEQAFALTSFVGRGGGLYATGDGAKFVPPDFLPDDIKAVLPVRIQAEPKPENPPDPPVEEEPTLEVIAKVSVCFVLDRSNSMKAYVGDTRTTRWQVATQGVVDSVAKLSIDARASVLTFTLAQNWLYKPQVFLEHNREFELAPALRKVEGDQNYDESMYNTDIYAAMKSAIETMQTEPSAIKMIIMLTDGADRPANDAAGLKHSDLRDLAISKGIEIVTVGIGEAFADGTGGFGAQAVIRDLATKPEFAFMPATAADALKAHTIFVNSVSTAFKLFDDKKKAEEERRRKRLEEWQNQQKEPPRIDALKGTFPLVLQPIGEALFGQDALGATAPKVQWYARNTPRPEAAVALGLDVPPGAPGEAPPAALAFGAWGLGRTAFWAAGTQAESLGEVTGWAEFPGMFAASLRWLTPREVPDLRLVGRATPGEIEMLDPIEGATYTARTANGTEHQLELKDGILRPLTPLPEGAYEIMENLGSERRMIGDVYLAAYPEHAIHFETIGPVATTPELRALPPEKTTRRRLAETPVLYLVLLLLMVLPLERYTRRRS